MGFNRRFLTKELIKNTASLSNIDIFKNFFHSDGLILMDDFSIKIYDMILKSKCDNDILNIMNICIEEK